MEGKGREGREGEGREGEGRGGKGKEEERGGPLHASARVLCMD